MADGPLAPTTPASAKSAEGPSLRYWGVLVFVMFLLTSAVGGSLALESSYLPISLASHIGLALVTLGVAGYTASFVGRTYRPLPRASAGYRCPYGPRCYDRRHGLSSERAEQRRPVRHGGFRAGRDPEPGS